MTNKKLGLLLAPLLPLTAIGIVEVAGALASMNAPKVEIVVHDVAPARHFAEPAPAPPTPTPSFPPESIGVG